MQVCAAALCNHQTQFHIRASASDLVIYLSFPATCHAADTSPILIFALHWHLTQGRVQMVTVSPKTSSAAVVAFVLQLL